MGAEGAEALEVLVEVPRAGAERAEVGNELPDRERLWERDP